MRNPLPLRLGDNFGIVGIEEDVELRLVEVTLVGLACGLRDPVGVVEHYAEITDASDASLRAYGRLAGLDARIAEDAFLGFARRPVVIDLLVGAAGDAHAPTAALVLVDQDDAVLLALVDRARRAGRDAGRVEAVLAQPRQVHHEGVFELPVDVLLDALEIVVLRPLGKFATENLFPVRTPFDLLDPFARHQRARPRGRHRRHFLRLLQMLVVERERLVVIVDLWQIGVGENVREHAPLTADARLDLAVVLAFPATFPARLVFPVLGIADTRLGFDVVEPRVFHAFAAGPHVLASDTAGVTTDALVEVQHHRDLSADFHSAASKRGVPG